MKINEVKKQKQGTEIQFVGKINKMEIKKRKNGQDYLQIRISDDSDSITFPIWSEAEKLNKIFKSGQTINVKGKLISFNGQSQISYPILTIVNEEIENYKLMPKYEIPEELVKYFEDTINSMEYKYKEIAIAATGALGYNQERWEAFTHCVAGEKNYGNKIGGLLLHTIGVMKNIEGIVGNYITNPFNVNAEEVINKDRLMLKAVLHDIMKTKTYEYKGIIKRKNTKISHIELGVSYINQINIEVGNILNEEELYDIQYSILSQYGEYGVYKFKTLEDKLLHIGDMIDSQISIEVQKKISF
ncbi:phosphohydrolase [Clostridium sp. SHJSY1]|uniref:OB-fold nucleic acid binding domain-containing protein n=1 Tax=Clostridium sp. SHJSY1 TaxID=2942483 RepID=UPI0028754300|nr:phosphohydrolase [Clostridium sp. SHJSY1]MDS0527138.1 phosphohydrolase [Clostridium sp. SHJSY1]